LPYLHDSNQSGSPSPSGSILPRPCDETSMAGLRSRRTPSVKASASTTTASSKPTSTSTSIRTILESRSLFQPHLLPRLIQSSHRSLPSKNCTLKYFLHLAE